MKGIANKVAKLIDVKSIVTLFLTVTFVILAIMDKISGDRFYAVFIMIISFYFGTQHQKSKSESEDI